MGRGRKGVESADSVAARFTCASLAAQSILRNRARAPSAYSACNSSFCTTPAQRTISAASTCVNSSGVLDHKLLRRLKRVNGSIGETASLTLRDVLNDGIFQASCRCAKKESDSMSLYMLYP